MRIVSNSAMAVLVVVALFWGNCFSCPQVLLSSKPAHDCCDKTKKAPQDCSTQALRQFVKADPMAPSPALPVVAAVAEPAIVIARLADPVPAPAEHAPPGHLFTIRI